MAPTESTILSNFLLAPAQLPTIISMDEFKALFPLQHRSSAQVRSLYRDLQRQRSNVVEVVSENIAEETSRHANVIRRQVTRADRIGTLADEYDAEDEVEKALVASSSTPVGNDPLTNLSIVVQSMETSLTAVESQIKDLHTEETRLLELVKKTVGDLSDLRYGRLSNASLPQQVLDGLKNLQDICENKNP
ncbi:hypothetical protein MCOR27_005756 [Pyricularia oryzae]|uniref:Uncharacterized protein n=1 Tax=Pyricularia grisea TaxID=148305 RepID=A0ABQ8NU06_PYRGI|nr:hypothetical protein MCOR01_006332 [Pyricularia oryzae]KAI6302108.1 hypothetical protein MCOR33_002567 [Pyricularia grisea]KAH9435666.1 hypothetical protein MCOR02_004588 [Pyricularia oryzae]KAI6259535.1 hypothetical protein MCOR19_004076 [Pyricularia oryzae]KAI6275895.1 hypothetical protein MCOR26_005870 [Pyricularia oryzae]